MCTNNNVLPGVIYCCFNYNVHKIFTMTLHAGLVNPTWLQSFRVCELRCFNSKKKEKNFGRIGIFYLTSFPSIYLHDFLVTGVI